MGLLLKCPYCGISINTRRSLAIHVRKCHQGISNERLLADVDYGGVRPTCKCGCGKFTKISYFGGIHFNDYIAGHQARIHNNWGHNAKAIRKSSDARRRQYDDGTRTQWNKGKKWAECYSSDKIIELRKIYTNPNRNRKISDKLHELYSSTEKRRELHDRMTKFIGSNAKFKISSKKEDDFVDSVMSIVGDGNDFVRQYYISDISQYCDLYSPSRKLIIEFNGDFWHGNPTTYKNSALYECQALRMAKDEEKRKWASNNGFCMVEVWESDYDKNKENVLNKIKEIL